MGFRPRLRERGSGFRSKRVEFWLRYRERERKLGFRPRLRERGPGFRSKRVEFWLRFREREKAGFSAKAEREREPGFRSKRVGFWLRFREREREKARFSAMNLERQSWDFGHGFRERERAHLQRKTTFTLRERLRFSPRESELGD